MRIGLAYPETPMWPKWSWVERAVQSSGHDAIHITTIEGLHEADKCCELILFAQQGAGLHPGAVIVASAKRKTPWYQWCFNLNATEPGLPLTRQPRLSGADGRPNMHLLMMRAMDAVLVKEMNLIEEYLAAGVPAQYFDQGCPSWMPACEHPDRPEYDVLFFGNGCYPDRRRDVTSLLAEGFTVAWVGQSGGALPPGCRALPPAAAEKLPDLCSKAALVLAVDWRPDIPGYHSDRTWMALGMGACVLRRRFPQMPSGMEDRCLVYDDVQELVDKVRSVRADRIARAEIGRRAREWTMSFHTYEHRINQLIEMLTCRSRAAESASPVAELAASQ